MVKCFLLYIVLVMMLCYSNRKVTKTQPFCCFFGSMHQPLRLEWLTRQSPGPEGPAWLVACARVILGQALWWYHLTLLGEGQGHNHISYHYGCIFILKIRQIPEKITDTAVVRRSSLEQNANWVQEQMVAMCGGRALQALELDSLGQQPWSAYALVCEYCW